jgi:hypothetical protein
MRTLLSLRRGARRFFWGSFRGSEGIWTSRGWVKAFEVWRIVGGSCVLLEIRAKWVFTRWEVACRRVLISAGRTASRWSAASCTGHRTA